MGRNVGAVYFLHMGFTSATSHPSTNSKLFSQLPAFRCIQPEVQLLPALPSALGQLLGPLPCPDTTQCSLRLCILPFPHPHDQGASVRCPWYQTHLSALSTSCFREFPPFSRRLPEWSVTPPTPVPCLQKLPATPSCPLLCVSPLFSPRASASGHAVAVPPCPLHPPSNVQTLSMTCWIKHELHHLFPAPESSVWILVSCFLPYALFQKSQPVSSLSRTAPHP